MFSGSFHGKDSQFATIDLLACRLVMRALPIRFRIANSLSDLEQVFRLRYQVVVEKGWAKPESFPDGTCTTIARFIFLLSMMATSSEQVGSFFASPAAGYPPKRLST